MVVILKHNCTLLTPPNSLANLGGMMTKSSLQILGRSTAYTYL